MINMTTFHETYGFEINLSYFYIRNQVEVLHFLL